MKSKFKNFQKIIAIFCAVFLFGSARSQQRPFIKIILSPQLQQGLEVVSISDLDFLQKGGLAHIFDIEIFNVQQDWEQTRIVLELELNGQLITKYALCILNHASHKGDAFLPKLKEWRNKCWTSSKEYPAFQI